MARLLMGQSDHVSKLYIQSISQLRSEIIEKDKINLAELHLFYTYLDSLGCTEMTDLLLPSDSELQSFNQSFTFDTYKCALELFEKYPSKDLIDSILINNKQLIELIKFGIVEPQFPFKIKKHSGFYEELAVYDITESDRIAEIGAGDGTFAAILNNITNPNILYVNDLDSSQMALCISAMKAYNSKDTTGVVFSLGSETETNIQDTTLDKVILRRTYHHFDEYKKMLKSIHKNLKKTGYLFLLESKKKRCREAKSKSKIKKQIANSGFTLVSDIEINDYYILKFVKVPYSHLK
ncbi:MAG: class I SAM-dependent methyltransferase [Saprospiraceae bacterium]